MRKIYLAIFIACLLNSVVGNTQQVFIGSNGAEYIFIGSIKNDSVKVLADHNISWMDNHHLVIKDVLKTDKFLKNIFENKLFFRAEGDEPFWGAEIYVNRLMYNDGGSINKHCDIKIYTNQNDIDNTLVFMFSDSQRKVFGTIRSLGLYPNAQQHCNLCLNDELSVFEVFICIDQTVFKGCATISKN